MSEHNGLAEQHDQVSGPGRRELLTPKASAVAAFTLAVLSMQGQGSWTTAIQSLLGTSFGPHEYRTAVLVSGIATLALAVGAMLLARQVLSGRDGDPSWEDHLARAAVLVAGLGAVLAVVTVIGGLLSHTP